MATATHISSTSREKLERARKAASSLAQFSTAQKNTLLLGMADAIESNLKRILDANREDVESSGLSGAMRDRLLLNAERVAGMALGVREVVALEDPIGEVLAEWDSSQRIAYSQTPCATRSNWNHL